MYYIFPIFLYTIPINPIIKSKIIVVTLLFLFPMLHLLW